MLSRNMIRANPFLRHGTPLQKEFTVCLFIPTSCHMVLAEDTRNLTFN